MNLVKPLDITIYIHTHTHWILELETLDVHARVHSVWSCVLFGVMLHLLLLLRVLVCKVSSQNDSLNLVHNACGCLDGKNTKNGRMSLAWHLIVWNLRKVVQSLEVPLPLPPVHIVILWLHFGLSGPYWDHWSIIMASDDQKMHKQGTAGDRTHVTLTIPQKLENQRHWKWWKLKRHYGFIHVDQNYL